MRQDDYPLNDLKHNLAEYFKSDLPGKGCQAFSFQLVKDQASAAALSKIESDIFKIKSNFLIYQIPPGAEYAGSYTIFVKATNSIGAIQHARFDLTLINPCSSEKPALSSSAVLAKTFTLRQPHAAGDLKVDFNALFITDTPGKSCP